MKVSKESVYLEIKDFWKRYQQYPGTGFLAGRFKTSRMTINTKLHELDKDGLIKMVLKNKKFMSFKLYEDNN